MTWLLCAGGSKRVVVHPVKGNKAAPMPTRLSPPLLRIVLFFVLTLTVALPTTALAKPLAQRTVEATLLAYFESDIITEDDSSAWLGLSFYDDDTFEMSVNYIGEDEPVIANGTYEETDDGVTLTILAVDGEEADEGVELPLVWDADDTLVIVGSPDGLMGEEDIILYPVDVALDDDAGDDTDDDAGLDDDLSLGIAGIYVSPIEVDVEGEEVVYLLNLAANGDASLTSDYLNMQPPIFEVGTWTENDDNTVTVEIVGTVNEEYDRVIILTFEIGEYGELFIQNVSLYPIQILSYLEDDSTANALDNDGEDNGEVYLFIAEVLFPGDRTATDVYLFIYEDGTVIMTDETESETLYGEWVFNDDDTLTVSITGDSDEAFAVAVDLVFEFDNDGALVAIEYPVEVFGEDDLIFYPVEADNDEPISEGEFYFYESDVLPIEDTDGIVISLVLSADGAAMVSTDFLDDEDPYLEYGEWMLDDDGIVVITISEGPDGVYDDPYVFTFEEDQDDLSLVLIEESVEIFGEAGLVLHRVE